MALCFMKRGRINQFPVRLSEYIRLRNLFQKVNKQGHDSINLTKSFIKWKICINFIRCVLKRRLN